MALYCEECFYTKFYKSNKKPLEGVRWWRCGRCGHVQLGYKPFAIQQPRELYIDIETSPNMSLLYDLRVPSKRVNEQMILKDWFIIGWSAEWMNCYNHKNFSAIVTPNQARAWDDSKILMPLRNLIDEADIVWGHNVNAFDKKKINTRLLLNGILPPAPYKTIDTLSLARRYFAFASNKLDFINNRLGLDGKHDVDLDDWKAVLQGDKDALKKILKYNINDVKEGIAMVKKLREWIVPFPNVLKIVREEQRGRKRR